MSINQINLGGLGLSNPSAGGFGPLDIDGLHLWLDATDLALSDGDAVGTWEDKGPDGYDVTQSTSSKKPIYKTGIIGGGPILRFDGVDDFLTHDVVNWRASDLAYTFFMVVRTSLGAGSQEVVFSSCAGAASNPIWGIYTNLVGGGTPEAPGAFRWSPGVGDKSTTSILDGNPHIFMAQSQNPGRLWRLDGAIDANATTGDVGGPGSKPTGRTNIAVACYNRNIEDSHFGGDLGEIIYYDSALGSDDIADVESYLSSKWGIAIP